MWLFYYFYFERNYEVSKSRSPCFLLNKNINYIKNDTESKMENPSHTFRDMSLVLQLTWKSRIRLNCDDLELVKEKKVHLL